MPVETRHLRNGIPRLSSQQRLAEIEKEFNEKVAQGWFAADISEKRDVLIREFDPNAEILLIPRVQGGL